MAGGAGGEEGEGRGRLGGVVTLLTVVEWNVAGPAMNGGGCVTSLPLLTAADSVAYMSRRAAPDTDNHCTS